MILNNKQSPIEKVGEILLHSSYWDCDCKNNYIHPTSKSFCL